MTAIESKVKRALDAAKTNGYDFANWTSLQIAEDMVRCDSDLENEDHIKLSEIVEKLREP